MTWNYRVVTRMFTHPDGSQEPQVGIYSAYYHTPSDSLPHSISTEPASVATGSLPELEDDLRKMLMALTKPTLTYEDFAQRAAAPRTGAQQSATGQPPASEKLEIS